MGKGYSRNGSTARSAKSSGVTGLLGGKREEIAHVASTLAPLRLIGAPRKPADAVGQNAGFIYSPRTLTTPWHQPHLTVGQRPVTVSFGVCMAALTELMVCAQRMTLANGRA